jgi:hypothetical protein
MKVQRECGGDADDNNCGGYVVVDDDGDVVSALDDGLVVQVRVCVSLSNWNKKFEI